MSDHIPDIPEDLITDILLRLPVKSIGRFKCVSKQWQSSLSSPQFHRFHLNSHQHNKGVFVQDQHIFDILTFDNEGKLRDSRDISFPMFDDNRGIVEGSCDGLVLLRQESDNGVRFLVNPITLEAAEVLPEPFHHSRPQKYCLGYDSFGDDYEIASLECNYNSDEDDTIHIYSVRTKTWKTIEDRGDHQYFDEAGTFVNGCVHWLVYGFAIVALNLSNEVFEEFPLPQALYNSGVVKQVTVLGGWLSLVSTTFGRGYDVWVMKEYGKHDSWTKLFTVNLNLFTENPNPHSFQVVCVLKEDEVVLLQINDRLFAYNWRCEDWECVTFSGFHDRKLGKATAFTESLLSPNGNW